ncbi:PhzF family phenazine biosynthesis protein [Congregibacter brevis]|uniref:PhzF family phenazine biosynthesis protein n=1 Tax=Congregibacter brevis TaxID=3081201 RepID=A0ABZ0IAE9_9GAMM|nr:PhzF family phenazine biosynthesis protein [Congregibacter sp. IMCC45268]
MSTSLNFSQVDVFSSEAYRGNPVAVVHDADVLSVDQMACFARWTNLSETTFLLTPTNMEADYRLRIFTPAGELPFAGHPTLGSCHAWLEAGGEARDSQVVMQECEAGLVRIRRSDQGLAFAAPPVLRSGALEPEFLQRLMTALKLPGEALVAHQWVDNGPGWCALQLDSAQRVLDADPDMYGLGDACLGLVGAYPESAETDFEVRAFVPSLGVPEDPVTGSLNASIAQWLIREGRAPNNYVASQGTVIGRAGRIQVIGDQDTVWIGGQTMTCIHGRATF